MNEQPSRKDLVQRNILKRPSISASLQPNADALEIALLASLQRTMAKDKALKPVEMLPLFKSTSANKDDAPKHRRKHSGFGTKKNQNPEYYKHDIAPKLQATANQLHRRRISQTIEKSLLARPTKEELVDQRILYKDQMASSL